jgi:hypothetical protein
MKLFIKLVLLSIFTVVGMISCTNATRPLTTLEVAQLRAQSIKYPEKGVIKKESKTALTVKNSNHATYTSRNIAPATIPKT